MPVDQLPVELPEVDDYSPRTFDPDDPNTEPSPPLSRATEWINVELDLGDGPKMYRRDANTMPQLGRLLLVPAALRGPGQQRALRRPGEREVLAGPAPGDHGANDPGGVDLYIGGVEHAVLHLLYSRFWQKVLFDLGEVSSDEPYRRLFNQGYIQAYAYTDARGVYVPADEVRGAGRQVLLAGPARSTASTARWARA